MDPDWDAPTTSHSNDHPPEHSINPTPIWHTSRASTPAASNSSHPRMTTSGQRPAYNLAVGEQKPTNSSSRWRESLTPQRRHEQYKKEYQRRIERAKQEGKLDDVRKAARERKRKSRMKKKLEKALADNALHQQQLLYQQQLQQLQLQQLQMQQPMLHMQQQLRAPLAVSTLPFSSLTAVSSSPVISHPLRRDFQNTSPPTLATPLDTQRRPTPLTPLPASHAQAPLNPPLASSSTQQPPTTNPLSLLAFQGHGEQMQANGSQTKRDVEHGRLEMIENLQRFLSAQQAQQARQRQEIEALLAASAPAPLPLPTSTPTLSPFSFQPSSSSYASAMHPTRPARVPASQEPPRSSHNPVVGLTAKQEQPSSEFGTLSSQERQLPMASMQHQLSATSSSNSVALGDPLPRKPQQQPNYLMAGQQHEVGDNKGIAHRQALSSFVHTSVPSSTPMLANDQCDVTFSREKEQSSKARVTAADATADTIQGLLQLRGASAVDPGSFRGSLMALARQGSQQLAGNTPLSHALRAAIQPHQDTSRTLLSQDSTASFGTSHQRPSLGAPVAQSLLQSLLQQHREGQQNAMRNNATPPLLDTTLTTTGTATPSAHRSFAPESPHCHAHDEKSEGDTHSAQGHASSSDNPLDFQDI